MSGTLADWERNRFSTKTADEIDALPETADPVGAVVNSTPYVPTVCLLSRMTAGLGVQLLWNPISGDTFVTVTLNGETETFAVPAEHAREAFDHPYCFGASLPL